jgi:diacylglycerol O-acyltransferase
VHTARLSPADTTWLRLDRPENRMVVTAVVWLDGRLDEAALHRVLGERLADRYPRFRSLIRTSRVPFDLPHWEPDPDFDVRRHVERIDLAGAGDAALEELVGRLLPEGFDTAARPPWRMLLVDGYRASPASAPTSVVVARLHHCLADGAALVRLLLELTDGVEEPADDAGPGQGEPPRPPGLRDRLAGGLGLALAVPVTAARLLLLSPEPATPVRGPLGPDKVAAWASPRPLADVKAAAEAFGATVNDVLLAAVAGGVRRYLAEHGLDHPGRPADGEEPSPLPRQVRVYVPVDVGAAGAAGHRVGNRFGLLPLRLPVAEPDAHARVLAVADATRRAKRSPVPVASFVLIGVLGLLPGSVRTVFVRLLGSRATAIVTNVPGPRRPRSLAGVRVDGVAFWVPQAADVGVGVSLFSYDGTVRIGVAADARLVPDARHLADAVDAELAALLPAPITV